MSSTVCLKGEFVLQPSIPLSYEEFSDHGVICTLDNPVYLTRIKGKTAHCLDRSGRPRTITFDPTEYRFKLALLKNNYEEMLYIIKTSTLLGQSIIAYLQQKGFPEVGHGVYLVWFRIGFDKLYRLPCISYKTPTLGLSLPSSVETSMLRWRLLRKLTVLNAGKGSRNRR